MEVEVLSRGGGAMKRKETRREERRRQELPGDVPNGSCS